MEKKLAEIFTTKADRIEVSTSCMLSNVLVTFPYTALHVVKWQHC